MAGHLLVVYIKVVKSFQQKLVFSNQFIGGILGIGGWTYPYLKQILQIHCKNKSSKSGCFGNSLGDNLPALYTR